MQIRWLIKNLRYFRINQMKNNNKQYNNKNDDSFVILKALNVLEKNYLFN